MRITKKEAYFTSSNGFTGIHCNIWQDNDQKPKALFQISHGVSEHINRYEDFAEFMAGYGYIVFGNDHLGHGESVFDSSEYGYFGSTDGDKRLVDDLHILSLIMKKRYPDLPLVLFGHSMGSLCARVYAADFPDEYSALILSGTAELPSSIAVLEGPVKRLCKLMGDKTIINGQIADRILSLGVKDRQDLKDWLSYNPENVEDYHNDPLCGKPLTLGGVRDILSLAGTCCSTEWAKKLPEDIKLLIISGAKDPVGLNGKGITALCDNLEDAGIDPDVYVFPGLRHEILNEKENLNVYKIILDWTNKQVEKRPVS